MDDQLAVLPLSVHVLDLEPISQLEAQAPSANEQELQELKDSLQDTQPVGCLINCCKTLDQVCATRNLDLEISFVRYELRCV